MFEVEFAISITASDKVLRVTIHILQGAEREEIVQYMSAVARVRRR